MHDFLDGMGPGTCENCRSRWFAPAGPKLPKWASSIGGPPSALGKLCMTDAPSGGGARICRVCEKRPTYLTSANNMYIGQSFPELNRLTDVEQMCVARVQPHCTGLFCAVWTEGQRWPRCQSRA